MKTRAIRTGSDRLGRTPEVGGRAPRRSLRVVLAQLSPAALALGLVELTFILNGEVVDLAWLEVLPAWVHVVRGGGGG